MNGLLLHGSGVVFHTRARSSLIDVFVEELPLHIFRLFISDIELANSDSDTRWVIVDN